MGYTRQEIIQKCEKAIIKVEDFYKCDFVNYRGRAIDSEVFYSEIVAQFVLDHLLDFEKIRQVTRNASYKVNSHDGRYNVSSNRVEEITAMKIYNQSRQGLNLRNIGRVLDYQIPLKNIANDKVGKIDLISFNNDTLYLLELKREDSKETMLRCLLEGFTYYKTVDISKLKDDYELPQFCLVKVRPLVFYKKYQWSEMQEDRPMLRKLMITWDIKPLYLDKNDDIYSIKGGGTL